MIRRPNKPPTCRQRIGRFFDVNDVAAAAVPKIGMGKFVGNHVVGELLWTVGQPRPQHDAAAAVADSTRGSHPQRPSLTSHIVVECNSKPLIIEKVPLHGFGKSVKHCADTLR